MGACCELNPIKIIWFRILGTPNEETWPGVQDLPDYKSSFPMWRGNSLKESCKALDNDGLDLLQVTETNHFRVRLKTQKKLGFWVWVLGLDPDPNPN